MSLASAGRPGRTILVVSNLFTVLAADLSATPMQAQTPAAVQTLPPVEVSPPVRYRPPQAKPGRDAGQGPRRVAAPRVAPPALTDRKQPGAQDAALPQTPLNSNAVAESA